MKSTLLLPILLTLASANIFPWLSPRQGVATTTAAPSSTTTSPYTVLQSCLATCTKGDVNCEAVCVGSAHPTPSQANHTNACTAKCVKGDGSSAANKTYAACVQACITSDFPTSQTTGGLSSVAATATKSTGASVSGTATTSIATSTSSNAAGVKNVRLMGSAGGLLGLLMAVLAL